jgi:hypothetical protein
MLDQLFQALAISKFSKKYKIKLTIMFKVIHKKYFNSVAKTVVVIKYARNLEVLYCHHLRKKKLALKISCWLFDRVEENLQM